MKAFIGAAGLAAGASAAILPRDQCCFQITASGGKSGTVGQLSDGQNRIGGSHPAGTYCLNNGGLTDSQGRGCILTPPTTQFQCDQGATPTTGFSIGPNGQIEHNGSDQFYACAATDSEYNIYTTPVSGQEKCVKVTLSSGGKCGSSGSGSSSASASSAPTQSQPAPSKPSAPAQSQPSAPAYSSPQSSPAQSKPSAPTVTSTVQSTVYHTTYHSSPVQSSQQQPPPAYSSEQQTTPVQTKPTAPAETHPAPSSTAPSGTQPATSAHGSACQTSLTGAYQTPHLIVPVSSSQPDKSYGTQYNATIKSDECTVFNFDIPQSYSGKSCSTVFLFPEQSQLETSSYTFSGSGNLVFSELSKAASQDVTWKSLPSKKSQLGSVGVSPGNSYAISTESCAAGTTQSIEVCGTGDLSLEFFEDWNPSPIGVFITSC
ncbi:hypothetical protein M409DRAFT_23987 [Zasmidium cellare ATCC 36951]|uniref:Uncharacterized protein n=1 Tax=Zasmidium cellare ATCC 36951 TaxID=1080233 RepID=A0A6A6CER0_ZASCE|nr:uncharacterized protein M409DRAFT_23987 [Zasmidium cellare ATCC 36951]KAF2165697.1 hypothetical protein M409DRAFT_23987 [Zasmidium cellare ATCC 36951]